MGFRFVPDNVLRLGSGRGVMSVGGGATSVLSLPSTNLLLEFCADLGVTNTTAVDAWNDQSVNGYHVSQSGAARPTLNLADAVFSGKKSLSFSGSQNLRRVIAAPILGNITTYTAYTVFAHVDAVAALKCLWAEGPTPDDNSMAGAFVNNIGTGNSAGAVLWYHRPTGAGTWYIPKAGTYNDGVCHIMTIRRISATVWSLRVDGVEVVTSAINPPSNSTANRLSVGALERNSTTAYYTGKIATIAAYSSDNYQTIEPILGAYYGVTLPPFDGSFTYASTIGT